MATLTIDLDNKTAEYAIAQWETNLSLYISKLLQDDMLLKSISESKKSWIYQLNSLNDLDN